MTASMTSKPLYAQWQQTVQRKRSETAVRDLRTGERWTFAQLASATEAVVPDTGGVAFPQGHNVNFILEVLRAWRDGQTVCPLDRGQARPEVAEPSNNIAHLKITSATSGTPKMVALTARQMSADCEQIVSTMGLRCDRPNLGIISMSHSYGFSNLVLPLLLNGIPLYLLDTRYPEELRIFGKSAGPITLPAVPALWKAWHEAGVILTNIRLAISAGASLPLELEREIYQQWGLKVHNFLGASECGGIAYDSSSGPREEGGYAGELMQGVEGRLNQEGCLVVQSPAVGEEYWPYADPALSNGLFITSDLAELKERSVHLRGRKGDMINIAGRKISPEAIERVLNRIPGVSGSIVFGVPDKCSGRGEMVVAMVANLSGNLDLGEVRNAAAQFLPDWQMPRHWRVVSRLPVNERGKISRALLRQEFQAEG